MSYEYKTVGAPETGKRRKGARTASDRAAVAFEEILKAEAVDGWEYLRTDILPLYERRGWFAVRHETHRAVMVFRRPLKAVRADADELELRPATAPRSREPVLSASPELRMSDPVRGPGTGRDS